MPDGRQETIDEMADWWKTSISDIGPGVIRLRGHDIAELIDDWSFVSVIWLMVTGAKATPWQSRLLEASLVASVDHGPQAPSIAAARMAATCGIGINNAIATGANLLGDNHGGAGQQCVEMLYEIRRAELDGIEPQAAVREVVARWKEKKRYLPGFGHRFHPIDPRRDPLLSLIDQAAAAGEVSGDFARIARAVEAHLSEGRPRPIPMNIDGATAAIYAELGVEPQMARGLFVLARSVGIFAHAYEEMRSGTRIKGPMPKSVLPRYVPNPG